MSPERRFTERRAEERPASARPAKRRPAPTRPMSAPRAIRSAADQLQELLGRAPEAVSAVRPTDDGWEADVEVLELERIPETTSVLASYRVRLDPAGELTAYERVRRYTRGQIDRRA
ncbi:gas vesicle protein [Streptomyces sp. ODS05-4]|uniref:gas vesicle protein GvpO n=1 Tax=Streptomyces sp. ODS05-4 TaxID=2944939 RepID=UPI00210C24C7|nr:gas vesicle protein [Streptomyces sp. ODS05-4]